MRISSRSLIFAIVIGVIILCVYAVVYVLFSRQSAAFAPPVPAVPVGGAGEPEATQPVPTFPVVPSATPVLAVYAPAFTPLPAIKESRRLTLEFPPRMRVGDSDIVRLTLEVDTLGNITPTAQFEGNVVTGQVIEIPNVYDSHHVIAEARFDVAGMLVAPSDLFSQTLSPGQSVTFLWSIRPSDPGIYRGTIWLYLQFVDKLSGEESRKTVSAQIVEIEVVNLFGLSANIARSVGVVGSIVGTVIGFPFLEEIVKFLFGRRLKREN